MSNTTKVYNSFSDIHGNAYAFGDYMSFATWFFSVHRRTLVAYFTPETFKRLNYAATKSDEARKPVLVA